MFCILTLFANAQFDINTWLNTPSGSWSELLSTCTYLLLLMVPLHVCGRFICDMVVVTIKHWIYDKSWAQQDLYFCNEFSAFCFTPGCLIWDDCWYCFAILCAIHIILQPSELMLILVTVSLMDAGWCNRKIYKMAKIFARPTKY